MVIDVFFIFRVNTQSYVVASRNKPYLFNDFLSCLQTSIVDKTAYNLKAEDNNWSISLLEILCRYLRGCSPLTIIMYKIW